MWVWPDARYSLARASVLLPSLVPKSEGPVAPSSGLKIIIETIATRLPKSLILPPEYGPIHLFW